MAERSKAWVCSHSPAEIAGSNPAGSMDVCVVLCVLHSKDKKHNQDNEVVHIKYREQQKSRWWQECYVVCVV